MMAMMMKMMLMLMVRTFSPEMTQRFSGGPSMCILVVHHRSEPHETNHLTMMTMLMMIVMTMTMTVMLMMMTGNSSHVRATQSNRLKQFNMKWEKEWESKT